MFYTGRRESLILWSQTPHFMGVCEILWADQDKGESNIASIAIMGAIDHDDDDEDDLDLLYEDTSEYE
ncbi:MAG: hypothetical protein ACYS18_05980 [Planctomycetota bacterium]